MIRNEKRGKSMNDKEIVKAVYGSNSVDKVGK